MLRYSPLLGQPYELKNWYLQFCGGSTRWKLPGNRLRGVKLENRFGQQGQGSEKVSEVIVLQCFSALLFYREAFLLLLTGIKTVMINNASN